MYKLFLLGLTATFLAGCMHCVKEEEVETRTTTTTAAPAPQPAPAPVATSREILFERNKAVLTPEGTAAADQIVAEMQRTTTVRVEVGGYASGESEAVAQQRANAVRDYMVSRGIESGRIDVRSHGAAAGDDRLGRKVTITVR